jgi:hypothetical protein
MFVETDMATYMNLKESEWTFRVPLEQSKYTGLDFLFLKHEKFYVFHPMLAIGGRAKLKSPKNTKKFTVRSYLPISNINFWKMPLVDMSPYVMKVVNAKVRILSYYGDTDMACNFLLGQQFSAQLGLQVINWLS